MQKPKGGGKFLVQIPGGVWGMVMAKIDTCISRESTRMLLTDDIASTTDTSNMPTSSECCHTLLTAIWTTESTPATAIDTSVHHYMTAVIDSLKSVTWDWVRLATNSDEDMATLLSLIESGMLEFRYQLPPQL